MSSTSSAAGSQQPSNAALTTTTTAPKSQGGGCSDCNSQLWSSYVVGLLACFLVVGGIFLAFHRWDYLWLAVSGVGVLLILIGASLHYCGGGAETSRRPTVAAGDDGTRVQKRKRGSNHHRIVCEMGNQNERLLPTAPPNGLNSSGHNFSVSQLSLNMLPPFFPSYDTVSLGTAQVPSTPTVGQAVSPIMHLNGQSFLLLPIGSAMAETPTEANSLARRLSTHLAVLEQQSLSQKRVAEAVNFGLVPGLSSFAAFNTANDQQSPLKQTPTLQEQQQLSLQITLTSNKEDVDVQTVQENGETSSPATAEPVIEEEAGEPIYQVPRSPSTPVDNSVPQLDPNLCANSVDEHPTGALQTVPDNAEVALESASTEGSTLPSSVDTTQTSVQHDALPNNNTSGEEANECQNNIHERDTSQIVIPTNSIPTVEVVGTMSQRAEEVDHETLQSDLSVPEVPDSEWTLPPSYEEVAQPNFKRLGHLKFAYETL